jgi:hypothetical protein
MASYVRKIPVHRVVQDNRYLGVCVCMCVCAGPAFTGIVGLSRSTPPFLENSDRDFFEPLYLTNYYAPRKKKRGGRRGKKGERKGEEKKKEKNLTLLSDLDWPVNCQWQ